MNRKPFKKAQEIFSSVMNQEKTASSRVTKEDLFELGLVSNEVEKLTKVASYVGQEIANEVTRKLSGEEGTSSPEPATSPTSQGETPLGAEQSDGGQVPTDHEGLPPFEGPQVKAMKLVQKALDIPEVQDGTPDTSGKTLSHTDVTSGTETSSSGAGEKMSSDDELLDNLLGIS